MNIAMLEPLDIPREYLESLAAPLAAAGHGFVPCLEALSPEEKAARIRDAEAIIIANAPLKEELLGMARKLKYISVAFTGTDHVDKAFCRDRGIALSNAAGYSTVDVAEITVGFILSLLRSVVSAQERLRAQGTKQGLPARRLRGKTVGLVGTGAIGLETARLLSAFGCELLAYSRSEREEGKALGIRYLPLDEVLKESDIVSLHTPLTDKTRGLINAEMLALMKPGALLVNCARGPVVDSLALAEALNNGHLGGAAIDVYETEPPIAADHPLLSARNTLLTPHIAFYTRESMKDRAVLAFDNVLKWLDGRPVRLVKD